MAFGGVGGVRGRFEPFGWKNGMRAAERQGWREAARQAPMIRSKQLFQLPQSRCMHLVQGNFLRVAT